MVFVRQIVAALLAVSVAWAGVASAQPGHSHDLDDGIGGALHLLSAEAHAEHDAAIDIHGHDHGNMHHSHDDGGQPDEQSGQKTGGAIFHVHAPCLIALEPQSVTVARATVEQSVYLAELVVPLHTRSVMPADRPPRSFL